MVGRTITEYVLDNSALRRLVEGPGGLGACLDAATAQKAAIFVPGVTIGEFLNYEHPQKIRERLQALICLTDHGGYSRFGVNPRKMLELEATGRLSATPWLAKEYVDRASLEWSIADPDDPIGYLQAVRTTMSKWKEEQKLSQESMRATVRLWVNAQLPDGRSWSLKDKRALLWQILANMSPRTMPERRFREFLQEFKLPPEEIPTCLELSERYKAVKTLVGMNELQAIGQLLFWAGGKDPEGLEDLTPFHRPYLKPDKNDLADATVAMSAAYADFLVTDDEALSFRCEFLRSRGCVNFRTLLLEDFIRLLGLPRTNAALP